MRCTKAGDLIKFVKRCITYISCTASIFVKFVLQVILGQIATDQEHTTNIASTECRMSQVGCGGL